MVYTEIKEKNGRKYYYRVKSIRDGKRFKKQRIYLGKNLSKKDLSIKEEQAGKKLMTDNKKKKEILNKIKPEIIKILRKNKVKKAGIFGSYVRGEQKKNSDIDIIVEPPKGVGFGFVGIKFDLEKGIKRKVDLVTYKSLHPLLREKILKDEMRII